MKSLARLEVVSDIRLTDGWLKVARRRLRNHYTDSTVSAEYTADSAWRQGIDAVAVLPWRRRDASTEVLLRQCLRPGLDLRARLEPPTRDAWHALPVMWEIPAGIPEDDERGDDGLARCGARELREETGLEVAPENLVRLGAPIYPSGGILTEQIHLYAARLDVDAVASAPEGDGTPFEEVGGVRWWSLEGAVAAFRTGELADAKTEVALWRLQAGWVEA